MNFQADRLDEDTVVISSAEAAKKKLEEAVYNYEKKNFHSVTLNDTSNSSVSITTKEIDSLALGLQNNLTKVLKVGGMIRYSITKDDILGKVYEAIETNVNPQWELKFPSFIKEDPERYEEIRGLIEDFNEEIGLESLITEAIPMTYVEGNYAMYLRKDGDVYQVDHYPLGTVEVSEYSVGGNPYILMNMKQLQSRLKKTYRRSKKKQPLFFKDMDEEIKNTYPKEVYEAFRNKEPYAKLNIENSGIMRVNNMRKLYGVSPIFKALKPSIRLENIELSDDKNTLVRGKKIIFQKLNMDLLTKTKEMGGEAPTWYEAMTRAHQDLMVSLSQPGTSVYTGTPWTEDVKYIEPKLEQTDVQKKNQYRKQIMSAVGISFLANDNSTGGFGASSISIKELMKTINRIGEQLARVLKKWYKGILKENNIEENCCPNIKILDTELLERALKIELATFLFDKLGSSYETVYEILDRDVNTEKLRRERENKEKYEKIFEPRLSAYTVSGKEKSPGTPKENEDKDKKDYDKERNMEKDS